MNIKITTKAEQRKAERERYIERHANSLIGLLRQADPERAREVLRRLSESLQLQKV